MELLKYNVAAIRKLLIAAFTAAELRRLCYDHPKFKAISDQCPMGCGIEDIADRLTEYCEKRLLFPDLLDGVRDANPGQYERFASQLIDPSQMEGKIISEESTSTLAAHELSLPQLEEKIEHILCQIAQSGDDLVDLTNLIPPSEDHQELFLGITLGTVALLRQLFDPFALVMMEPLPRSAIRPRSEIASYFLRSLAEYANRDLPIVSNWDRKGAGSPRAFQVLASGAQFLFAMECKRQDYEQDPVPTRVVEVVIGIIKARIDGQEEPVLLMRFDSEAGEYQTIGGIVRADDADLTAAMQRELMEELDPKNRLGPRDFTLNWLKDMKRRRVSRTYGAYTEYHLHACHVVINRSSLILSPIDRWVTLTEVRAKRITVGGHEFAITADGLTGSLGPQYPGGLDELPFSLKDVQQ